MSVSEEEVQRSRQELSSLRQNRLGLDADVQEQSRLASQLHTRVAVLEQEVKDKEQVMQRTSDLLGSHQEQKVLFFSLCRIFLYIYIKISAVC